VHVRVCVCVCVCVRKKRLPLHSLSCWLFRRIDIDSQLQSVEKETCRQ
jgi:hypothetical protein